MKNRTFLSLLTAAAFVFVFAPAAEAQVSFGAQGSWGDDFDLGLGARVEMPLPDLHEQVRAIGSFDYFFPDIDNLTYWEINANGAFSIPIEGESPFAPYVGGGLNIARFSFDTDAQVPGFEFDASSTEVGLNVLGGSTFPMADAAVTPFGELRIELSGGEQFVLTGGVLF